MLRVGWSAGAAGAIEGKPSDLVLVRHFLFLFQFKSRALKRQRKESRRLFSLPAGDAGDVVSDVAAGAVVEAAEAPRSLKLWLRSIAQVLLPDGEPLPAWSRSASHSCRSDT